MRDKQISIAWLLTVSKIYTTFEGPSKIVSWEFVCPFLYNILSFGLNFPWNEMMELLLCKSKNFSGWWDGHAMMELILSTGLFVGLNIFVIHFFSLVSSFEFANWFCQFYSLFIYLSFDPFFNSKCSPKIWKILKRFLTMSSKIQRIQRNKDDNKYKNIGLIKPTKYSIIGSIEQ